MLPAVFLLAALDAPVPHLRATFTTTPPSIDGKLDDAVWALADATEAFTQKFPDDGRPPTERTRLRVLYDHDAIYVAFDCVQLRAPVIQRLTRRDRQVEADWVEIDLGTRRDRKTAFQFQVNASGTLLDAVRFNDTDSSTDWDENWDAKTALTDHGWSAEIVIPLRILRFDSLAEQSWDLEARRYVSEREETDEWAYIPRSEAGEVSHYGKLEGLRDLRAGSPLELRPFVLGRVRRRDPGGTQLDSGTDLAASAGLDLKWHATQALTLDATFNPDFAQVEADQLVLNLTKFETYYPEKRPFFLEGIDLFTTPRQLLYTRRIGRGVPLPVLRTDPQFAEQLVEVPQPATIYGASKLTGELADHWTVGTLQALTAENTVPVQILGGAHQDRLVDPLTSFNVVRVKRALDGNGYVGAMFTATERAEPTDQYPLSPPGSVTNPTGTRTLQLCPSGALVPVQGRCFNNAYVGAIDWMWRSHGGDWVTGGQATATMLDGPTRVVPDGTLIQSGDIGPGLYTYLNKEGGKHYVGDVSLEYEGRKLDYTDLGYNQRSNDYRWRLDLEYRELERWWKMLESHARFEYFGRANIDGLDLGSGYQFNVSGKFTNFWSFFTEVHYRPRKFDDREVGDGTALERDGLFGYELELYSDPTKRVSFQLVTQSQAIFDGVYLDWEGGVLVRALPQLDFEILPTFIYNAGEPRYTEPGNAPGQYVFGKLEASSIGATMRATYTFTPRLSLQTYAQLFLASGHYNEFTFYQSNPVGPRPVVYLSDLQPFTGALATNPDFEQGVLNLNVVLRWEYVLGSTAYLVYTRSQVPNVILAPGENATLDLGAVRRAPAADIVVLKVSYWWG